MLLMTPVILVFTLNLKQKHSTCKSYFYVVGDNSMNCGTLNKRLVITDFKICYHYSFKNCFPI